MTLKPGTFEPQDLTVIQHTPDGDAFAQGNCICVSQEFVNEASRIAGEMLVTLGQNVCAVWVYASQLAGKTAVEVVAMATPAGPAYKTIRTLAKIVKRVGKVANAGAGGDLVQDIIKGMCGVDSFDAGLDWESVFAVISAAKDDILAQPEE